MVAAARPSMNGWRRKTLAMPVPTPIREVRPAMPATVVMASLLKTPSTRNTLSKPRSSACTARSTAARTPTSKPQRVSPMRRPAVSVMPGMLHQSGAAGGAPPPTVLSWPRREGAMDRTLITGSTIFDGSGAAPYVGDVLVEGPRIAAVQRGDGLPRGDARVIDGAGATLMPGLIEPHGHLSYPDAARNSDFTRLPPEEHVLITMRNAKTALDCGYTSVLSAASAKPRLDIVIRNEINAGRIPGPRYLANGPELTVTGGLGDENLLHLPHVDTPTFAWVVNGPDEVRKACRLLVREGVDLLKLNLSGDTGPRNSRSERGVMTDAEVAAAMEIAQAGDVRVCAHARSAESVKMCVRHGIGIIYHANFADAEGLDLLEANRDWA